MHLSRPGEPREEELWMVERVHSMRLALLEKKPRRSIPAPPSNFAPSALSNYGDSVCIVLPPTFLYAIYAACPVARSNGHVAQGSISSVPEQ
jgi:hypothetical protein